MPRITFVLVLLAIIALSEELEHSRWKKLKRGITVVLEDEENSEEEITIKVYEGKRKQRHKDNLSESKRTIELTGVSNESPKEHPQNRTEQIETGDSDLCPMPEQPNFHERGHRISTMKCHEYMWKLGARENVKECLKKHGTQIIGGRDTKPGEFPHMAALGWRTVNNTWDYKCGASLISPKFVLTAAHCSKARKEEKLANLKPEIVRLGDKNIRDQIYNGEVPVKVRIKKFTSHPQYSPPKKYLDIAVVELAKEVEFSDFIRPACLWPYFDTKNVGTEITVTGWGVEDEARETRPDELQVTSVDIIDLDQCNELLLRSWNREWCEVLPHQICAGKLTGGSDTCQGDSGGPLQTEIPLPFQSKVNMHYIIGVTSFGIQCAKPLLPSIYTGVYSFLDWIETEVWDG